MWIRGRSLLRLLLLGACLVAFYGCGINSEVKNNYVHPDLAGRDLEGVLVVGVTRQQKARVKFEDDLTRALNRNGVRAVASHTLVPQEQATVEEIVTAAESADLDTLLVTRYIEASSEGDDHKGKVYYGVPPAYGRPHHSRFGDYYSHAYEAVDGQPVWTSNLTHVMVSDLYVAATGEHLWQAVTETLQASSSEQVREDVINDLIRDLRKQGLVH